MTNIKKISCILLYLFWISSIASGQSNRPLKSPDRIKAENAIQQLKEGVLVVKLISDRKKIEVLNQNVVNNPNNAKARKELERTIQHRQEFNENLIQGLKDEYYFSSVVYMYDFEATKLVQGVRTGIFMNDELQKTDIDLTGKTIFVLGEGKAGESGIQAFIVHSDNMKPLEKPFPYYFKRNDFFKVFLSIFDSKSSKYRNLGKMAKDMNKAFESFYKSSI